MVSWNDLHLRFLNDQQAEVELMAMMWRQIAEIRDPVLNSNLVLNGYNSNGLAMHRDYAGLSPDIETIEWARFRGGYPPPFPFIVFR
jgi:hypothetical protein